MDGMSYHHFGVRDIRLYVVMGLPSYTLTGYHLLVGTTIKFKQYS